MGYKIATRTLALFIGVGFGLAVSGCGKSGKSDGQGSDSENADCRRNLGQIGLTAREFYTKNNETLTVKGLSEWLGGSAIKPQCPSGSPYFICNPTNYDEGVKIFAYCPKHLKVLLANGEVNTCNAADFKSQTGSNLLNNNDVAAEINKVAATVPPDSNEPTDPNPTGTWTSGDRNSVYSRLTVRASGSFSFETVDFTGDVKGGYSGTWRMDGKSVRFEWGKGGADSGASSGRKTGGNTLVFGSTTFRK